MEKNYKNTMKACYVGFIVQAIVNNFVPLLFLTFQSSYGISITKITFLVTFNFGLQLLIDFISPGIIDKVGYRVSVVTAHIFAAAGLIALTVLPELFSDPFTGLMAAVVIYAMGGGLIEVLISPIMEACPNDHKGSAMGLLHSFYCWGHVGVVLLSTVFFALAGIGNWKILALIWSVIPLLNAVFFLRVPIGSLLEEGDEGMAVKELLVNRTFWLMVLLMVSAGASEQSVSQWASAFAEKGLGISKTVGDLAGPMMFAGMMGIARVLYSRAGKKVAIRRIIFLSSLLCIFSYLLIALSPWPVTGLIGCGLCGFSVGVLWPGTFSMSASEIKRGGTVMFAYLALAGDLGCSMGPTVVGKVSALFGDNLKAGIGAAVIFPVLLVLGTVPGMVKSVREQRKQREIEGGTGTATAS